MRAVDDRVRAAYSLPTFGGDRRACARAIAERIRELKMSRRDLCLSGLSACALDYERFVLRRGAYALQQRHTYAWVNDGGVPHELRGGGVPYPFAGTTLMIVNPRYGTVSRGSSDGRAIGS